MLNLHIVPETTIKPTKDRPAPAAGDMLYGTRAIAQFLGVKERQALALKEKGALPHWHEGRAICARPSTLRAWLAEREAAGQRGAR